MTATTTKIILPPFEGQDVARSTIKITNAGDGLSEALAIQPEAIALGDERFYLLRGTCTKVGHDEDKNELLVRVHTIKARDITGVDGELAQKLLAEAKEELQRRVDEVEGQLRLDALQAERAAEERERHDSNVTSTA